METSIELHCPACGLLLTPRLGCCSSCLARAVQLQSRQFGTEVSCAACGRHHVVRCIEPPGIPPLPETLPQWPDRPAGDWH